MEWISVKSKLPELGTEVFIYYDGNALAGIGVYDEEGWYDVYNEKASYLGFKITHWAKIVPPTKTDTKAYAKKEKVALLEKLKAMADDGYHLYSAMKEELRILKSIEDKK